MKEIILKDNDKYITKEINHTDLQRYEDTNVYYIKGSHKVDVYYFDEYIIHLFTLKFRNMVVDDELEEYIEKYSPKNKEEFIEWCRNRVMLHRAYLKFIKERYPEFHKEMLMNKRQDECDYLLIKALRGNNND